MATNTTVSTAGTTYLNKTYYDKTLLETAKAMLVYQQFGQKRSIPRNGGKTVEFRKYTLFEPDAETQKLTEGVTPNAQSLAQTKVEATVAQYGAYVEISDLLELTAYDPVIGDSAELLGEQMGIVVDNVTRDAMAAEASDQFAGGAANQGSVAATSYLTVEEVRKAVRTLKANKARRFKGDGVSGHFVCIVDPYATFDQGKCDEDHRSADCQAKSAFGTAADHLRPHSGGENRHCGCGLRSPVRCKTSAPVCPAYGGDYAQQETPPWRHYPRPDHHGRRCGRGNGYEINLTGTANGCACSCLKMIFVVSYKYR